jgi:hypothetical protein
MYVCHQIGDLLLEAVKSVFKSVQWLLIVVLAIGVVVIWASIRSVREVLLSFGISTFPVERMRALTALRRGGTLRDETLHLLFGISDAMGEFRGLAW